MRVAYYAATLLEIGGGLEKYFIETARDLSEIEGVHVDIFTMDDAFNMRYNRLHDLYFGRKFEPHLLYRESYESITSKLGRARYIKNRSYSELRQRLQDYDVLYARNEFTEPFLIKFAMGYRRLPPVIFGCHIPHIYPMAQSFHARLHNLLYTSMLYTWVAKGVTGYHVINNFSKDVYRRQFPHAKIRRIYYPFDAAAFAANAGRFPFKGQFAPNRFNILWAGRLTEQKGVRDLIDLIDRVNPDHQEKVAWQICGDGDLRPLVFNCRERWKNVTYWGHVENSQMASAYDQADVFITTSRWEGYPYNVQESLALGKPTLAYDIPGCQDMIENAQNGFVVKTIDELADRLVFLIKGNKLNPDIAAFSSGKTNRNEILNQLIEFFTACCSHSDKS